MERRLKRFLEGGQFTGVSKERSRTMSSIRGKNNRSTELRLRMALARSGIKGWKLHARELPGTPDFYFPDARLAVFVDGCFWHGCSKCGHIPKTRSAFWDAKINRTKQRDRKKRAELRKLGVRPMAVWEHELEDPASVDRVLRKIRKRT